MAFHSGRPAVLITGANVGIGSELVPYFAGTEHNLVLAAREKPVLEGIAAAVRHVFRVETAVIACDLSEPEAAQRIADELAQRNLEIDVLVNNAGLGAYAELDKAPTETEEGIIQANLAALTSLTGLLLPGMKARGCGKILNVAYAAGSAPVPAPSAYRAAGAYVLRFSESLAEELEGTGITVTALCPDPAENESAPCGGPGDRQKCQKQPFSARIAARTGFRALIRGDRAATPGWRDLVPASLFA